MKRAFTLIEVMVVLSILAIIAILAYNFFGSTMKDASLTTEVVKVHNGLRVLADAHQEYIRKNGQDVPGHLDSNDGSMLTYFDVKSLPPEPKDNYQDFSGGRTAAHNDYNYDPANRNMNPAAGSTNDGLFNFAIVTDEFCVAYNARFAPGLGTDMWRYPTTNPEAGPLNSAMQVTWCAKYETSNQNYVFWISQLNK